MALDKNSSRVTGLAAFCVGAIALVSAPSALAFSFDVLGISGSLDSKITLGGQWRVENRDEDKIGKSNLQPGLCLRRETNANGGPISGDGCNSTSDPTLNDRFVREPGSFSPNGDDGNLNYDKWDVTAATVKMTSDLSFSLWKFDFFVRGLYFFDEENENFRDRHPDTTFQNERSNRPEIVNQISGEKAEILDAYVSFYLPFFGDREISVKAGDQVVNWGESTFLLLNSINSINAPNAARLRTPGFDIKELFIPSGMVVLGTELFPNFSTEMFWQYEFDPAVPDPTGTFFSSADTIVPGGTYAALSFSKAPEDPDQIYNPTPNSSAAGLATGAEQDATGLFSSSSRSINRVNTRRPDSEGGQYGIKLAYFAEELNGGTEFGLYYINYHSRFPIASFNAADASCAINISSITAALDPTGPCGFGQGDIGSVTQYSAEPLPVETAELFAEYPEDIKLWGFSFNTTVGDWAWSGEIAYRPNQPFQLNSTDLVFAALQPAFPAGDIPICASGAVLGACAPGDNPVTVVPGRRSAIPDNIETRFRESEFAPGLSVGPNNYVQGYERMKSWNVGTTFLNTLGGGHWASSFLGADQIIVLFEAGFNYIEDFPSLHEIQFNGAATDTHISAGASPLGGPGTNSELGPDCTRACRQNPIAEESENFPDAFSWGTRNIFLIRYQDALLGANLEPLIGVFADWNGIGPGPGNNFIEGRKTYIMGLRMDYLNKWTGEFRYTVLTGEGTKNPLSDRDNVFLFAGYEF